MRKHCGMPPFQSNKHCDYSISGYRDELQGPFWSWSRFGRTSTPLPDGRIIHIAGEYEDFYDPDFCIYNDVVVEHPSGHFDIYLYPRSVFPPTDFHSATLVGDEIFLLGSLGYQDLRRIGETQVLKLNTNSLSIEAVTTMGQSPGWIFRHTVEQLDDTKILVVGGQVQTADGFEANDISYELDLQTLMWRARHHGDLEVFPVSSALYHSHKQPQFGTSNPEVSNNSFWLEMARRRWSASRARLHFGDIAQPQSQADSQVPIADDTVWTAVRPDNVELTLADGRNLRIGGQIADYGDEVADAWVYNDVIVTERDGTVTILTYPSEIFPMIRFPVGIVWQRDVFLFGIRHRTHPRQQPRQPVVLRLCTSTYKISLIATQNPHARVNIHQGLEAYDGDQITFPLVRRTQDDPALDVSFNLTGLEWSDPFPRSSGEPT